MNQSTYYSSGKLLISGEYAVLDGALALALPTIFGQSLEVTKHKDKGFSWISKDNDGQTWFSNFSADYSFKTGSDPISDRLDQLFQHIRKKRPELFSGAQGYSFTSQIQFPRDWGLGSSSSLIANLAQWAEIDAQELSEMTFGGSGYDVAVALQNEPILYRRTQELPEVQPINLDWSFTDRLFFVHLNRKQDSREAIIQYRAMTQKDGFIQEISQLTKSMVACPDIETFQPLMAQHEMLISQAIGMKPVQKRMFPDYPGQIKSLGGWGGDFVLAAGDLTTPAYFQSKGYNTVIGFNDLIKKAPKKGAFILLISSIN
ncbi:GYDIA family GHMP kinase [Aureitalea marina]|uniref:GHMP kinase n=1 Tax=Aureitalea marina TaxID=930804 RepID=A0A2S7KLR1_9FLAO|nr:GYDIA family GHMP kinase [Aureitalea marina]PQB03557.1 hypothetical protein BST85_00575 [Aureitalea marina]